MKILFHSIAISLAFFLTVPVYAETSIFAGGEVDNHAQGFTYLGLELSKKLNDNFSLAGRLMPNYLTYQFRSGSDLVRAQSPGLYGLIGTKLAWGQTSVDLFGGVEYRHTNLKPDVSSSTKGDQVSGIVQGAFDTWIPSRTNFNLFVSFSGISAFIYERGRIKQQVTNFDYKGSNTINLGVEQITGRNADFTEFGGGLIFEVFNIPNSMAFSVRGGYKHDTTFGHGGYGGLELYKRL
jgi:hypothetical protein